MKISTQLVFSVDPEFKKEFEKEAEKLRVETKSKRGCQKKLLLQMFKTWKTVKAEEEKRRKRVLTSLVKSKLDG